MENTISSTPTIAPDTVSAIAPNTAPATVEPTPIETVDPSVMLLEQFVESVRNGTDYDFICTNGYKFGKNDLVTILKEYSYIVDNESREELADNLRDYLNV